MEYIEGLYSKSGVDVDNRLTKQRSFAYLELAKLIFSTSESDPDTAKNLKKEFLELLPSNVAKIIVTYPNFPFANLDENSVVAIMNKLSQTTNFVMKYHILLLYLMNLVSVEIECCKISAPHTAAI